MAESRTLVFVVEDEFCETVLETTNLSEALKSRREEKGRTIRQAYRAGSMRGRNVLPRAESKPKAQKEDTGRGRLIFSKTTT